jgi:hypothetical protein
VKIDWISNEWGAAMSKGAAQAVIPIPLAPKLNSSAEAVDQLDRAAQTILGTINRAASATEANYRQAVEMTRKLV